MNILIAGMGSMAFGFQSLAWQKHPEWKFFFQRSKDSATSFLDKLYRCDALVVAISTHDDGSAARDMILKAVQIGKPAVTCEKGALSEYFDELLPYIELIGYNAACGGGSFILDLLQKPKKKILRLCGVLNGSLNNISSNYEILGDLEMAIEKTSLSGYTDPNAQTLVKIIMGELDDASRKGVICHNLAFRDRPVRHSAMSRMLFSEDGIYQLFAKIKNSDSDEHEFRVKRLVVQIFPWKERGDHFHHIYDPCFYMRTETHYIAGAFVDPWELPFSRIPEGIENCLLVESEDGIDQKHGQGAGIDITVKAMLSDLERLLNTSG